MSEPSSYDGYTSPLAGRYASKQMQAIWSPRHKFQTWRRIWLAVAEAQHEMGLPVTAEQVEELRANLDVTDEDMARAEKHEAELRHDVMAHVHAWGDRCPKARGIIHLGMTSQDVNDNCELLLIRESLVLIEQRGVAVMRAIGSFAASWKKEPTLGFTHYQPAQPVTVGRRAAQWGQDIQQAWRLKPTDIPMRGLRGATGTQAGYAKLIEGASSSDPLMVWKKRWFAYRPPASTKPIGFGGGAQASPMQRILLGDGDQGSTEYQYRRTAERLLHALPVGDLDKLRLSTTTAEDLIEAAGWDHLQHSTIRTYAAQIRHFLSWCVEQKFPSAYDTVDISPGMWPDVEVVFLRKLGVPADSFDLVGQTYPRVFDAQVLADLAAIASVLHKIATDIRLLSNRKELDEPFGDKQIGSSAMPYKRNPMMCERICGLSRFVWNLVGNTYDTAATQWLERTLDDSANRRLVLPEAFLALDGALVLMERVIKGLDVHEAMIRKNLMAELPFLATENILMEAVKAGADRQEYHEKIRVHAQAAGSRVKNEGADNDLIERLKADPAFHTPALSRELDWDGLMDPMKYVGLAVEQTERFLADVIEPLREQRAGDTGGDDADAPRV